MIIEVTEKGSDLPVGTRIEVERIPAWLVNKCRIVPDIELEVATPAPKRQYTKRDKDLTNG